MMNLDLEDTTPEIYLSKQECDAGRNRLSRLKIPVGIHVTPLSSLNKQWPIDRYEHLIQKCPDLEFVQLGLKDERAIAGAIDMRGLSLRESFATLKYCAAFVGPDSGLTHAAAALHVPTVAIFGPSSPDVWGHSQSRNLYGQLRCSPCIAVLRDGHCPYDRMCMGAITVQAVRDALYEQLQTSTPGRFSTKMKLSLIGAQ